MVELSVRRIIPWTFLALLKRLQGSFWWYFDVEVWNWNISALMACYVPTVVAIWWGWHLWNLVVWKAVKNFF